MRTLYVQCPKCGKDFNCISKHGDKNKFCSRSCANGRVWTTEKKTRHSVIAKALPTYKPAKFETRVCPCGNNFLVKPFHKKKCCCRDCSTLFRKRVKCGGYREGSGRSKSGYYKGVYCGSTYELCWVIYHIDKKLPFKRFEGILEKNGLKYYPDFLVDNTIIEIKGYWTEGVDRKKELAESFGYKVEVLYKSDLQYMFEYVKNTYGTNKFHTLYDTHKPSFNGVCCHCKKEFSSERKKPNTKDIFCSRSCSGKYCSDKYRKTKNTPCR